MNVSAPFISRPVATTLLTLGIALAGAIAFLKLPVAPLPQVDFPTISVSASLPGASPTTVASSVASPLERHLGQIANVTEMTSRSSLGQTRITLQFDLNRDINGAARDVQAAIVAARADLPASLKSNPTYRKVNPADSPILILAMTSKTLTQGQMYDAASNVFQQRLSQMSGVGQVSIGGSALPAVRVELNPEALFKYGIGLEDVRAALASANANSPKGSIDDGDQRYQVYTNDQATKALDYAPLVVAYRNGAAVRLTDVASVTNSVEDVRNLGLSNGQPSVLIFVYRQPGANIIETIDSIKAELPHLEAAMPADVNVTVAMDRSTTIRDSLRDTELTLLIAIVLVTGVVYVFLQDARATIIPSVAVTVSILGTFAGMYLVGYSLDILSLMALTIATGFVVDDAVVVLENITRYIEAGVPRLQATLRGAREVSFTVVSISLSLLVVFLPILLMGGIPGRLFREFTVTMSMAIIVSLVIAVTTTPMMCAQLLRSRPAGHVERRRPIFDRLLRGYERSLGWAIRHSGVVFLIFIATICLNVILFSIIPKGLFPQQDTGQMYGQVQADQSVSFQAMTTKLRQMMGIVQQDPAVSNIVGFTGAGSGFGGSNNAGAVFVALKPLSERDASVEQVIARLRPKFIQVPGGRLFLVGGQDLRAGGRQSNSQYQYTLLSDNAEDLFAWTPKLVQALEHNPVVTDVTSDQEPEGPGDRSRNRPRYGLATGYHAGPNRQHALRCVRTAPSVRHLQRDQPVPRHHGDRSALYAVSGGARRYLCGDVRRRRGGNCKIECPGRQRDSGGQRQGVARRVGERVGRGERQQQFGAQRRHQCSRHGGKGRDLRRRRRQHQQRDDDPACGDRPVHSRVTRPYPSATKDCSSRRPYPSICRRAPRSARLRLRSTRQSTRFTCRFRSTAISPAPLRCFSNRSTTSRC